MFIFRRMLYVYNGDVWVTEAGRATKQWKALAKKYSKKDLASIATYVFYVYTKINFVSNKPNMYWSFPYEERKEKVCSQYGLDVKFCEGLEDCEVYVSFRSFYQDLVLSENDRNYDVFRSKVAYWRKMLSDLSNTPKEDKEIADALKVANEMMMEFKLQSDMETLDQDLKTYGLYLFEVPEESKPHEMRLTL